MTTKIEREMKKKSNDKEEKDKRKKIRTEGFSREKRIKNRWELKRKKRDNNQLEFYHD